MKDADGERSRPLLRISAWPRAKNAAVNPFQALLYSAIDRLDHAVTAEFRASDLVGRQPPHVLHIHWPDAFLAAGKGWRFWPRYILLRGLFLAAAIRGIPVIWTAHNLMRDGQRHGHLMRRVFWPWFLGRVDGVIFMTQPSRDSAIALHPILASKPNAVIPHGHYGPIVSKVGDAVDAEGPPEALFFGSVTRYKNAHQLLAAFVELPPGQARLSIRGKMSGSEPDEKLTTMLRDLPPEQRASVTFEDRFLGDDELVRAIRASDLIVFPYSDVLNSGAAIFALSAGRPILASDNALFRELRDLVGQEWVRLIDGKLDATQLATELERARRMKSSGSKPDLSALEWDRIAEQTVDLYRQVIKQMAGNRQ